MKKKNIVGFVFVITLFSFLPTIVTAEDLLVKADFPKYEVVVGKDVTFKWHLVYSDRTQTKFELITSHGSVTVKTSAQEYTWTDFPYGSCEWQVKVWRDSALMQYFYVGKTSEQNFYHLNTELDQPTNNVGEFNYRDGPRGGLLDTNLYYEVLQDYSVNLINYFKNRDKTPNGYYKWDNTDDQLEDLRSHLKGLPDIEWDFLILKDGILTIKEGYRWDGASTPWNNLNIADNRDFYIRCSCVHDAMYDLMRMGYLESDKVGNEFVDPGYKNRLIADCMIYMLNVEDGRSEYWAQVDFEIIRFGGFGKTHDDDLLAPWKYHVSELTARVSDGKVKLNWKPADITGKDPNDYGIIGDIDSTFTYRPHVYKIYKCSSSLPSWEYIGSYSFEPASNYTYNERDVFITDNNVVEGETYYYQVRSLDTESSKNWQDRHHDESIVTQIVVKPKGIPGFNPLPTLFAVLVISILFRTRRAKV